MKDRILALRGKKTKTSFKAKSMIAVAGDRIELELRMLGKTISI